MHRLVYLIPLCADWFPSKDWQEHRQGLGIIGSGTVLVSFLISVWVFMQVKDGNTHIASYFNFISVGKLSIPFAFQVDQLSSIFLLIITGVSFLIHVYSISYMHEEKTEHFGRYFPT